MWFVGMFVSHVVLGKCVLNWVAQQLKSKKTTWESKSRIYTIGYAQRPSSYQRRPKTSGANLIEVQDNDIPHQLP